MLSGALRVIQGTIVSVSRSKWTCVVKQDNGIPIEDVAVAPIYLNRHGNGIYYLPEIDAMVLVAEVDKRYFLLGSTYPIDEEKPVESVEDTDNIDSLAPAHNASRPIMDPGDYMFSTRSGGFFSMKQSGLIEVGASQIARRFYIPLSNFIRDLCQNYQLNTAGGNLDFITRVGDTTHGYVTEFVKQNPSDPNDKPTEMTFFKSPVEFNLNIKEFAEDDTDTIQISMGRLEPNDGDNSKLLGSLGTDFRSSVVFRCNIANKFTYFIDKFGTVVHTVSGSASFSYESGYRMAVKGSKLEKIGGENRIKCLDLIREVKNTSREAVSADKITEVLGNLEIVVGKNKKETILGSKDETITSASTTLIKGSSSHKVIGDSVRSTTGNLIETVAETTVYSFASDVSLSILSGDYKAESFIGNIDFKTLAGTSSLTCTLGSEVGAAPTKAYIKFSGGSEVQANATGSGITSAGGQVSVDTAGNTRIGAKQGNPGFVITTSTNPVCFVTGLPLLGAANVVVNATVPSPFTAPPVPSSYSKV